MKIYKSFTKNIKDEEFRNRGGLVNQLSWETLKPYLEKATELRENERLIGIEISNEGIKFYFD